MGVKVMQPELIDQRLFHLLVKNEKAVGVDRAPLEFERSRHMPVDVDGLAVLAVAGEIGNVVPAIELDAAQDRIERPIEHEIGDVPLRQLELLVRRCRVADVERHGADPQMPISTCTI